MVPADQEDGAPCQRKHQAKGGDEVNGENVQRAQRERDLAESQARNLEYQKGALSEQLATMSEQPRGKSKQLEHSSK